MRYDKLKGTLHLSVKELHDFIVSRNFTHVEDETTYIVGSVVLDLNDSSTPIDNMHAELLVKRLNVLLAGLHLVDEHFHDKLERFCDGDSTVLPGGGQ